MDRFVAGSVVSDETGASLKLATIYNVFYNRTDHVHRLPLNQWGILFASSLDRVHPGWRQRQARKGLYPFALKGLYGPEITGKEMGMRPYQHATEDIKKTEADLIGFCVQLTHTINGSIKALSSVPDEVDWAKRKARLLLTTSDFVSPPVEEVRSYIRTQFMNDFASKEIPTDFDVPPKYPPIDVQVAGEAVHPPGSGA